MGKQQPYCTQAFYDEVVAPMSEALKEIAHFQQKTLAMIERNGFVFESIGNEPGNWQHLAFTLYTTICEIDLVARSALSER